MVYLMSTLLFHGQRWVTLSMVMLEAFAAIALAATAAAPIIVSSFIFLCPFSFHKWLEAVFVVTR